MNRNRLKNIEKKSVETGFLLKYQKKTVQKSLSVTGEKIQPKYTEYLPHTDAGRTLLYRLCSSLYPLCFYRKTSPISPQSSFFLKNKQATSFSINEILVRSLTVGTFFEHRCPSFSVNFINNKLH